MNNRCNKINIFTKFFIVSYTSYIFIKHSNKQILIKPPILIGISRQSAILYKDTSCQTELTKNDIDYLQKIKKSMDNIDNGIYQWNII